MPHASMPDRILMIEDDASLASVLSDSLTAEGFEVASTADASDAILRMTVDGFDLVLLDLMLPLRNVLDVCREVRARGDRTPIVILSARSRVEDKITGLRLGADDYVTKPFEIAELIARMRALLRRWRDHRFALFEYRFGAVSVDFSKGKVTRCGKPVSLSIKELQLL